MEKTIAEMIDELEIIYRDFNGLMRLIYNNNIYVNDVTKPITKQIYENENENENENDNKDIKIIRGEVSDSKVLGLVLVTKKKKLNKKKLTKKKKRIVWNPWIIDTSSESD